MRKHLHVSLRSALALFMVASVSKCDCGNAVIVPDAGHAHVDASDEAGIVDVAIVDNLSLDQESADGLHADMSATDLEAVDGIGTDIDFTDSVVFDQATADAPISDASAADHRSADAMVDDAIIRDTGTRDAQLGDHLVNDIEDSRRDARVDSSTADMTSFDSHVADTAHNQDANTTDASADLPDCASGGLCIRLTWSTDTGDLDLHLALDVANYCSDEACYWANCSIDAANHVEWDLVDGISAGDPRLFGTSTYGRGPEVLLIPQPFIANYSLGVYAWPPSSLPEADVVLEVFSYGDLVVKAERSLSAGDFWELGTIVVDANSVSMSQDPGLCSGQGQPCGTPPGACPAL